LAPARLATIGSSNRLTPRRGQTHILILCSSKSVHHMPRVSINDKSWLRLWYALHSHATPRAAWATLYLKSAASEGCWARKLVQLCCVVIRCSSHASHPAQVVVHASCPNASN
jgi:hypothetical protein